MTQISQRSRVIHGRARDPGMSTRVSFGCLFWLLPDKDLHFILGFCKHGSLKLQGTICYQVEQTDWRIKFEKKAELLTEKEEWWMRRNSWREREEGREGGREETESKKKAGEDKNQERRVMLGTSTHSSHRSMHINTDREQHIHTNRNRHMCRHTGYRCRRPKGLVATDTWWYYLNSCSHLCVKRYLFIGLPGSKSWRCLSPLGLVNAKSSWSCPNLCHPMNYITGQASLSMGFSRQGYRSGLPLPPPEDLLNPWMEGVSLTSLALADRFFFFFFF